MKAKPAPSEAPFAYEGLDRVIHERARLSVLTSLISNPKGLTFGDLKQLCALTDGNLSRHLSVLEREKIVQIVKGHDRNRPQTLSRMPFDARAGSAGCGEGDQGRSRLSPARRDDPAAGLDIFLCSYFAVQSAFRNKELKMDAVSSLPST